MWSGLEDGGGDDPDGAEDGADIGEPDFFAGGIVGVVGGKDQIVFSRESIGGNALYDEAVGIGYYYNAVGKVVPSRRRDLLAEDAGAILDLGRHGVAAHLEYAV